MKQLLYYSIIGLVFFGILLTGCQKKEEPDLKPISLEEISGDSLWQRITEESDYKNYSYWPGHEGENLGQAPHGVMHRVFINKTLLNALPAMDKKAPDGSIIVKENLNAAKELLGYSVMVKVEGFNPEAGDWFWVNLGDSGEVKAEGKLGGCIDCHSGLADNDYIIIRQLDAEIEG